MSLAALGCDKDFLAPNNMSNLRNRNTCNAGGNAASARHGKEQFIVFSAVQSEVKGWGLAVSNGYWKPVLQAEVAPGAEQHFENLQMALKGSGIDILRR